VSSRKHWAGLFKDYSDEELLAYWSWARELERTPDNAAPNVHRKMRLAAERELRKRRIPQPED